MWFHPQMVGLMVWGELEIDYLMWIHLYKKVSVFYANC
jgi:hypothetical protein